LGLPILWVDAPQDDLLAQRGRDAADGAVDAAIGRAEKFDWLVGDGLDGARCAAKVVEHQGVRKAGEIAVDPGMAANFVSFVRDAGDLARKGLDAMAKHKKGGLSVGVGEDVEQAVGVVTGAVIEGEGEAFDGPAIGVLHGLLPGVGDGVCGDLSVDGIFGEDGDGGGGGFWWVILVGDELVICGVGGWWWQYYVIHSTQSHC